MDAPPYQIIRIRRDLSGVREAIVQVVAPGEKMTFLRFAALRNEAGLRLMLAWAESLAPLAEAEFGEPVSAILPLGTVRHHTVQAVERAPWHSDQTFFRTIGRGVTFWVTLDDAGQAAPGIEFEVDGRSFIPVVPAGSALMFAPHIRHRTQPIDGDRISVEFRVVPTASRTPECHAVLNANLKHLPDGRWLALERKHTIVHSERLQDPA